MTVCWQPFTHIIFFRNMKEFFSPKKLVIVQRLVKNNVISFYMQFLLCSRWLFALCYMGTHLVHSYSQPKITIYWTFSEEHMKPVRFVLCIPFQLSEIQYLWIKDTCGYLLVYSLCVHLWTWCSCKYETSFWTYPYCLPPQSPWWISSEYHCYTR